MAGITTPPTWQDIFTLENDRPFGFPFLLDNSDGIVSIEEIPELQKELFIYELFQIEQQNVSEIVNSNKPVDEKIKEMFGLEGIDIADTIEIRKMTPPLVVAKSKPIPNELKFALFVKSYVIVRLPKDLTPINPSQPTPTQAQLFMDSIQVYMKPHWDGMVFNPKFMIKSTFSEPPNLNDGKLHAFRIKFTVKLPVPATTVTVYLWDTDPEGTRGTETTVQDTTGN
jgi:hypothetical protein